MTILNTLIHMLDGMEREYEGDLERAPEYERFEREYCFIDDGGTVYRMRGYSLEIEEPNMLHATDEEPEAMIARIVEEMKPYVGIRARNATNRMETNKPGISEGQIMALEQEKIQKTADEDKLTEMILTGELSERRLHLALNRIKKEQSLLKLLLADIEDEDVYREIIKAISVRKLSETFKKILFEMAKKEQLKGCEPSVLNQLDNNQLVEIICNGKSERIREEADYRLCHRFTLARQYNQHIWPLSAEEKNMLVDYYKTLESLQHAYCTKLLDQDRQRKLFMYRWENGLSNN